MNSSAPFWEVKKLTDMSRKEWESLCDGCGRCCLVKLEDEDTGDIYTTDVSCKLLNCHTCRCKSYVNRHDVVDDCIKLDPGNVTELGWLPATCAYRLVWEEQPLQSWHPLISGTVESVHTAGISVSGLAVSEEYIHPDDFLSLVIENLAD